MGKSVFGRLPEDHPLMQEIRERKARERERPEPQPSFKQRNPEAWARERLMEMCAEVLERRKKKSDS